MRTRAERLKSIETLEKELSNAAGIYLTDYSGINVEKITKLRRSLGSAGGQYMVVKNSYAKIALKKCGKSELLSHLKGPVGIAVAKKDSLAPARVIKSFNKEYKDILGMRSAYVDGALYNPEQTGRLADLPPKEVLLSQFLSCLKAPMTNLAGSLAGVMTKLAATLEAVKNKKESQGA